MLLWQHRLQTIPVSALVSRRGGGRLAVSGLSMDKWVGAGLRCQTKVFATFCYCLKNWKFRQHENFIFHARHFKPLFLNWPSPNHAAPAFRVDEKCCWSQYHNMFGSIFPDKFNFCRWKVFINPRMSSKQGHSLQSACVKMYHTCREIGWIYNSLRFALLGIMLALC